MMLVVKLLEEGKVSSERLEKTLKSRILSWLSPRAQAKQLAPIPSWLFPRVSWVVLFPFCLLIASWEVAVVGFDLLILGLLKSAGENGAPAPISPGPAEERNLEAEPKSLFITFFWKQFL